VPEWPVERQLSALSDAGFSGPIYQDTMTRADVRSRRTEVLTARAALLRPTARKTRETIIVTTIRALALNSGPDLLGALKAAAERGATVRALAEDLEIPPNAGIDELSAASTAWDTARRKSQTAAARTKGNAMAASVAAKRRAKAVAIARPLWALPSEDIPNAEIERRAGISITTLYRALGPRTVAQKSARQKMEKKMGDNQTTASESWNCYPDQNWVNASRILNDEGWFSEYTDVPFFVRASMRKYEEDILNKLTQSADIEPGDLVYLEATWDGVIGWAVYRPSIFSRDAAKNKLKTEICKGEQE
jgi:hypothetical protein